MIAKLDSYSDRLRRELADIRADLDALIDASTIRNVNPNTAGSGVVFIGAADWGWAPSDAAMAAAQMRLVAHYHSWFERFRLLFPHPTPQIASDITAADDFARRWTERPDVWDHSIPQTTDAAKQVAAREFATFERLLDVVSGSGTSGLRLVPDTNALLGNPDLASYARSTPSKTFTVHLFPTVLAELDDLKERGKTPDLRDKAQGVVRRLKGLRDRGILAAGVKLTKNVVVQAEAREVDVRAVLDWLDPTVPDDRLLAAALRLQSDHPSGVVLLVTSDLNLQNKADAAGLPYMETPPAPSSLRARLVASLSWSDSGMPEITLTNTGPSSARQIEYSVGSNPDQGPPHFRSGPWTVERLKPGESDTQRVWGFYAPVVTIAASWTDDGGLQEQSWSADLPDRPD